MKLKDIPLVVRQIAFRLLKNNFEAYIVGGCVRDLLIGHEPKDWDIATSARPEEIQKLFPESIYENRFGTVGIKTKSRNPHLQIVEATTFRTETVYSDKRHPDKIEFAKTIEEDLARRDFTINALALALKPKLYLIDPFAGQKDLKEKIIRAVRDPEARFKEDALRLMRAIRFNVELGQRNGWKIEEETFKAIKKNASNLRYISKERIRDELIKILMAPEAAEGILLLEKAGLLKFILPELEEGIGVTQNKHHLYTVFEHNVYSLAYAAQKNYSLAVRLAALLHDIGKPRAKRGEGKDATFYGHEVLSAKLSQKILERLKFPTDLINKVVTLVRYHGFVYEVGVTTDSSLRRLLVKVGKDNIEELAKVREADRIGSGCPKALPFKLRYFLFRIEKILKEQKGEEPSLKMLKIDGHEVMKILKISPGPKVGYILNILLEEILDHPEYNRKSWLKKRVKELGALSEKELALKNKLAKDKYLEVLEDFQERIRKKYYV